MPSTAVTPLGSLAALALAGVIGFSASLTVAGHEDDGRAAVPSPEDIARATTDIDSAYGSRDIAAKVDQLVAENADRPARVFVLLDRAATEFLARGDFPQGWRCLEELARRFRFDLPRAGLQRLSQVHQDIGRLKQKSLRRESGESLFPVVEALLDVGIATRDYDTAAESCSLLRQVAKTAGEDPRQRGTFTNAADAAERRLQGARRADELAQQAAIRLKRSPGDQEASQIVGLYLCLYQSDWRAGLEHLAGAANIAVREAAASEMKLAKILNPTGDAAYAVAAAWQAVSREQAIVDEVSPWAAAKVALLRHEKHWNDRSLGLGIANEIDRNLAWRRRLALEASLRSRPHFVIGTWVRADGKPGWMREFKATGDVVATSFDGEAVTLKWAPESDDHVRVTANGGWRWTCSRASSNKLLVEEIAPSGKVIFSELHSRR